MATIIEYKNVEIIRQDFVVLKNVNFQVDEGQFVYLIGRVGSGKSSLMKTMYAEVPIEIGTARVFDYEISTIKRKEVPMLRRQIGVVFQDFQLLSDRSVFDNLQFVLKATGWKNKQDIEQRIESVLGEVGMETKSYKMPHELSGGEQQRIAIARALLNQPKLILADEPTGNLDTETGRQIMQLLHRISAAGTAVVMATHNIGLTNEFPARIVKCEDKNVVDVQ